MKNYSLFSRPLIILFVLSSLFIVSCGEKEPEEETIPLPEHPRPDFERAEWINLNGYWDFEFDGEDQGESGHWFDGNKAFSEKILVPFPWGSPLSEIENKDDIAWYKRQITIPDEWKGSVELCALSRTNGRPGKNSSSAGILANDGQKICQSDECAEVSENCPGGYGEFADQFVFLGFGFTYFFRAKVACGKNGFLYFTWASERPLLAGKKEISAPVGLFSHIG